MSVRARNVLKGCAQLLKKHNSLDGLTLRAATSECDAACTHSMVLVFGRSMHSMGASLDRAYKIQGVGNCATQLVENGRLGRLHIHNGYGETIRHMSIFSWNRVPKPADEDSKEEGDQDVVPQEGHVASWYQSAEMHDPDSLVGLTNIAEKAALESAMEGAWLPTRALQWTLESVHNATGLPWWQSIMLTTLGIRAITLPVTLMQIKNTYRLSLARPEVERLVEHLKEEQAKGNPNAVSEYQQQVVRVWGKYNANPLKSMAPIFVQAPVLIGFFSALRALAAAKVPSLVEGGALWFQDLSVADPTYALPLIASGTFLLMIELNAADGMEGQTDTLRKRFKNIMRGVAVLILPFTVDMPAAVFMYWTASNFISLIQSQILKIPAVKTAVGLPTLPAKGGSTAPAGTIHVPTGKPLVTYAQKPKPKSRRKTPTSKTRS